MGLSPETMVDFLGLKIIGGIYYTKTKNSVYKEEGLKTFDLCKSWVVLMMDKGTTYS